MISMLDYYNIRDQFTEEEKLVASTTKSFTDNYVLPIIEKHYSEGKFPIDLIKIMGELGLLAVILPSKYGGSELNYVSYGIAMQELERGDSGIRSFASVQNSLVIYPIFNYGTEDQKTKYLPKLATGEFVGCFGLTEPDFGSNPGGMLATATKTEKGYILNGSKMWITNGSIADIAVVWAKLEGKVNGFIVEKDTPGFTTVEMKGKHSLRASVTSELIFNDCLIPLDNRLEVEGLRGPLSCLNQARYGISWGAIGSAISCYETALNYAKTRIQFGKPIASFQIIQEKLVWMLNEITKAQLVSYQLGRLKEKKLDRPQQTSLAKRNNVDIALQCARLSREILGANGILNEYPIMRHMANLESVKTYEGTHDIHTLILGADITGIEAFS
mgnify:CR=1 FL=1